MANLVATVLIVGGKAIAMSLGRSLEERGVACLHARGPLRVRQLLDTGAVGMIFWDETSAGGSLIPDLVREWERYPHVPVVHLFSAQSTATGAPVSHQIAESVPLEGIERILDTVLAGLPHAQTEFGSEPGTGQSELAFRNIVNDMRDKDLSSDAENRFGMAIDDFRSTNTSINSSERRHLTAETQFPMQGSTSPRKSAWRWIARIFLPNRPENLH